MTTVAPRVSVLMAAYNVAPFIDDAIMSVLQQRFTDFELIIVDDGSTDDTLTKAQAWGKKDARVKVFTQKNGGVAVARNVLLDATNGELLTFVDPDDVVGPEYLNHLVTALASDTDVDVAMNRATRLEQDSSLSEGLAMLSTNKTVFRVVNRINGTAETMWQRSYDVSPWGKMYKRALFDGMRFTDDYIFEDFKLIPKIVYRANKIALVENVDTAYRVRKASIMQASFRSQKMDILPVAADIVAFFSETPSTILHDAAATKAFSGVLNVYGQLLQAAKKYPREDAELRDAARKYARQVRLFGQARLKVKVAKILTQLSPVLLKLLLGH